MTVWSERVGDERLAAEGTPSAGPVYRSIYSNVPMDPESTPTTLHDMFDQSASKYSDRPCLGYRPKDGDKLGPYVFMTYTETHDQVVSVSSGLASLGVAPKDRVGIYGANCPEWMIAMQACSRISLHCVPLYDSLGEGAVEYVILHSEATAIFTSTQKLPALVNALVNVEDRVKLLVYWGTGDVEAIKTAQTLGIRVVSFKQLIKQGKTTHSHAVPPKPTDLCTIMYTSGTTGEPKGVMLTHDAVVKSVLSLAYFMEFFDVQLGEGDSVLSYLPLAHIYDRVVEETFLFMGASIGYFHGDIKLLMEDAKALKPTFFIGVPRIFDRIYSRCMEQVSAHPLLNALYSYAFKRKLHFMRCGHSQASATPLLDLILFSKFTAALGGQVKFIISGGAPLPSHVEDFLRVCMCCPVVQGYGLTESCAASFIACPDVMGMSTSVGPPMPLLDLRLESVPEMNYDALDSEEPKGEVLIRGPQIFAGYYKAEGLTAEVLDAEGWFHTGDIGTITKEGALRIIDRKKDIFKLAQGEYVASEKVEAAYKQHPLVDQIFVYGDSFENSLVAILVPSESALREAARKLGLGPEDSPAAIEGGEGDEGGEVVAELSLADLCSNPQLVDHVLTEVNVTADEKLKKFEMVKALYLEPVPFGIGEELLTPTFKLKRPQLQKKYQTQIKAMYKSLGA